MYIYVYLYGLGYIAKTYFVYYLLWAKKAGYFSEFIKINIIEFSVSAPINFWTSIFTSSENC